MKVKAPGRLWFAVLLNFLVSTMGLAGFFILLISGNWPAFLGTLHPYNLVIYVSVTSFLYASCVMALQGKPRGRHLMLAAAIITYGINFFQSAHILYLNYSIFNDQQHAQFYFSLSVIVIELWINIWALDSTKTRYFFAAKSAKNSAIS